MPFRNLLVIVLAASATGCLNPSVSGRSYGTQQARTMQSVSYGEVVDIRSVEIEGELTGIGRAGGYVVGYSLGLERAGSNKVLSTAALGGILGSITGEAIERTARTQRGYEITVRLDSGREISVVQAADVSFAPGERVRVVSAPDGSARVTGR